MNLRIHDVVGIRLAAGPDCDKQCSRSESAWPEVPQSGARPLAIQTLPVRGNIDEM